MLEEERFLEYLEGPVPLQRPAPFVVGLVIHRFGLEVFYALHRG